MKKRKVLSFVVDRANYGRLKPVLKLIKQSSKLDLKIVATGTMVLRRFISPIDTMKEDGFKADYQCEMEIEGSTGTSMAKSIGMGILEYTSIISHANPDIVLIIGDRYEALAASIASTYLNVPVAHIQGGEISGSLDESARHAISKLARIHFPATERSADYLYRMGEDKKFIFNVGCPVGDVIKTIPKKISFTEINSKNPSIKLADGKPYLLVIQHPNTSSYTELKILEPLMSAVDNINIKTIWLWPNIDASSDLYLKELRRLRRSLINNSISFSTNFSPEIFQYLLKNTACAIGNSSSFIRDTTFTGTPVVLIGNRQIGREASQNVLNITEFSTEEIEKAIRSQLDIGRYSPSQLYGDGNAAPAIVQKLETINLDFGQKILDYVNRN